MLAKTICLLSFIAVSMAAPQFSQDNGDRTAQMKRVEDLRGKGLTCNEAAQETFVCSDGLGGDCLATGCPVGIQTGQASRLLQCSACRAGKYCGQARQKADRPRHKVQCIAIKEQKEKLAAEEAKLLTELDETDENPFQAKIGQFWFWKSTRPYMTARLDLMLALLNIRLMKDLEGLQSFLQKNPNADGEARYHYLQEEAMSDILLRRPDIVAHDDYQELIAQLQAQIMLLYNVVKKENPHFWPGVQNPMLYAYDLPTAYNPGSREEAVLVFRQSWYSWSECEAVIHYIRDIIRNDS
ncbi:hypothetical protein FLONG3_5112 [Fusarium longipes]|uniref:MYND-type domain-containing protein n=1 Tax=Fusarium longipes TaxID=694270 RepID=A0A395SX89_9HYPO|nr:hypothetical protein FLONG3_5112 [Fusarium longipes]